MNLNCIVDIYKSRLLKSKIIIIIERYVTVCCKGGGVGWGGEVGGEGMGEWGAPRRCLI